MPALIIARKLYTRSAITHPYTTSAQLKAGAVLIACFCSQLQ